MLDILLGNLLEVLLMVFISINIGIFLRFFLSGVSFRNSVYSINMVWGILWLPFRIYSNREKILRQAKHSGELDKNAFKKIKSLVGSRRKMIIFVYDNYRLVIEFYVIKALQSSQVDVKNGHEAAIFYSFLFKRSDKVDSFGVFS